MTPPLPDPYELLVCQIQGLQPAHLLTLLEQWGDARGILTAPTALLRAAGIPPVVVARIVAGQRQVAQVAAGLKGLARLSVMPVPLLSSAYPDRLRRSADPPLLIYVQGAWPPGEPLVAITAHNPLSPERVPIVRDWLARLPALRITVGTSGGADELVPVAGTLFVISYGLMLARQRLPLALREAVQSQQATVISATAINAPPDARSGALAEAMLLMLADAHLTLDTTAPVQTCLPQHFVLAFKDQPVDQLLVPGKRLRPDAGGARTLARALGLHTTPTLTVQQQRLL